MMVLRAFGRELGLDEVMRVGPMMGVVPLQEETRELLSLPTMQAPIEVATYKPGGALPREPDWGCRSWTPASRTERSKFVSSKPCSLQCLLRPPEQAEMVTDALTNSLGPHRAAGANADRSQMIPCLGSATVTKHH